MIKNKEVEKKEGSDLIAELISTINVEKGLSENTKIAYKNDIKLMIRWFANQGTNFIHANELDLRQLFAFLKKENLKFNSLSRKLSSIKRFYQFLKEENYIKFNPLNDMDGFKNQKTLPSALSESDMTLLLEKARENCNKFNNKTLRSLRTLTVLEILYNSLLLKIDKSALLMKVFDLMIWILNFLFLKKQIIVLSQIHWHQ